MKTLRYCPRCEEPVRVMYARCPQCEGFTMSVDEREKHEDDGMEYADPRDAREGRE